MDFTYDPVDEFLEHDNKQGEYLSKLPVCDECGEPIQEDWCYEINGKPVCSDCIERNHSKSTADYIERG